MEEDEAREWLERSFDVPRETTAKLASFIDLLAEENEHQNLVSRTSLQTPWVRHIADSAQLLLHAPSREASWVDLGSGAGFPGLIVSLLHSGPVTLVEQRRLRADFLRRAAEMLGARPEIVGTPLERVPRRPFGVISARALAPLPKLLDLGTAFSTTNTVWLLPKGKKAAAELEALGHSWQGEFRLEPSLTDPQAQIIVASGVRRRAKGKRG